MTEEQELEVMLAPEDIEVLQPDWKNPPEVSDLKADYEEAKLEHDTHVNNVAAWLDNLNITGSAKITTPKGRSSVQPKVIRKQAEWRYPSISAPFLSGRDIYNIYPVSAGDRDRAYQFQVVLNYQFNHKMNKVRFIDTLTRTLVDEGTVFVYTGWKLEEETYEEEEPIFTLTPCESETEAMETMQLVEAYQADPETFRINQPDLLTQVVEISLQNQAPFKAVVTGSQLVEKVRTLANHPEPEVLDYRSVIPDPTCNGDLEKANFVIRRFDSSLSELEKSGMYSNLDQIRPEAHKPSDESNYDDRPTFAFKDKPRQKLEVIEYWGYWDIDDTGIVKSIVASWVGSVMIRLEENPTPDGSLPFESAQLLPKKHSNYGEPDGELILDNQKLIGASIRGAVDLLARSANAQIGSDKSALDPVNMAKFKRGEDYQYNPGSDPTRAFYMHKFPEIPQSAFLMAQSQQVDAESMTGIKAFTGSQGLSGDALGGTATGVKTVTDATSLRNADILRRVADLMKRIGRKYSSMNAAFLTEEEVTRITNMPYVEVREDNIKGSFDIELAISTPEEDQAKAQELSFMLQTVGPNADPKITFTIMADIARLRNMPELAQKLDTYEPQPDPMQVQLQQLELAKLQAEIAEIQSRTQENYANAQLDMAKANTEGAKAGNLQSDTDLKDLNFVEQETGTKQERDKELMASQAESQAKKSIIENALKQPKTKDTQTSNGLEQV